jgi:hypothetical protein
MPGGSVEYRKRHRAVTSTLPANEYAEFAALAAEENLPPTTKATQLLRAFIESKRKERADDFEDSGEVYGGATVVPA